MPVVRLEQKQPKIERMRRDEGIELNENITNEEQYET